MPETPSSSPCDALIVGAGPAGLALATALAQADFRVTVLEQQPEAALAQPAPDGREIALTHPSVQLLQALGSWQRLQAHEPGRILEAQVHDGPLRLLPGLRLPAPARLQGAPIGWIVPNHALRRSAYAVARAQPGVQLISQAQVRQVGIGSQAAQVDFTLAGGALHRLQAPLVVAADSRFSATRRQLGVATKMQDFGRSVIVCRMRHAQPHHEVAHECFGYARTLAILPLPSDPEDGALQCSVVVTSDSADAAALMALPPEAFAAEVQQQFEGRLGDMALCGKRHIYPLVATYAQHFTGHRFALLGDAAVGMHPVTAHGFNLGLSGVRALAQALVQARSQGADWGRAQALASYGRGHHRQAWPIYEGTNAIVRLFTDARPLPRLARRLVLGGARRLPPLQAAIVGQLTGRQADGLRLQP